MNKNLKATILTAIIFELTGTLLYASVWMVAGKQPTVLGYFVGSIGLLLIGIVIWGEVRSALDKNDKSAQP